MHDIKSPQNKVIVVEDNPQVETPLNPPNASVTHSDSDNENVEISHDSSSSFSS